MGESSLFTVVELSVARIIRHEHSHGYQCEYPSKWRRGEDIYGCPHPLIINKDVYTDIRADVRVDLSVNGQFDQGILSPLKSKGQSHSVSINERFAGA